MTRQNQSQGKKEVIDFNLLFDHLKKNYFHDWVESGKDREKNPAYRPPQKSKTSNTSPEQLSKLGLKNHATGEMKNLVKIAQENSVDLSSFLLASASARQSLPKQPVKTSSKEETKKEEPQKPEKSTEEQAKEDWENASQDKKYLDLIQKWAKDTRGFELTHDQIINDLGFKVLKKPQKKNPKKFTHQILIPYHYSNGRRVPTKIYRIFIDRQTGENINHLKLALGNCGANTDHGFIFGNKDSDTLFIAEGVEKAIPFWLDHPKARMLVTFSVSGFSNIDSFLDQHKTNILILDPDTKNDTPYKRYASFKSSIVLGDKVNRLVAEIGMDYDDAYKDNKTKEWQDSTRTVPLFECQAAKLFCEIHNPNTPWKPENKTFDEICGYLKSAYSEQPDICLKKEYYNDLLFEISTRSQGHFEEILEHAKSVNINKTTITGIIRQIRKDRKIADKERKQQEKDFDDWPAYKVENNSFYALEKSGYVQVSNFSASIVQETTIDDGAEKLKTFSVSGVMDNNKPLPKIDITAAQFGKMDWVPENWGGEPNIFARRKDYVRAAIQAISENIEQKDVLAYSGWMKKKGKWYFINSNGAISEDGLVSDIDVDLGELNDYALPDPPAFNRPSDQAELVEKAFMFLHKLPKRLAVLLLASVFRAPLTELLPCDYSVFLFGQSGTKKSTISALALNFFGKEFDFRRLPVGWESTANYLEKIMFLAKDVLLVIDDFNPRGSSSDVSKKHKEADRVFRGQANKTGRGRMRPDGSLRPDYVGRGIVLSTGEDVPTGGSLRGRLFTVEVKKDEVENDNLTDLQILARDGIFAQIMSLYIQWLAGRMDGLKESVYKREIELRSTANQSGHSRTPGITASLMIGYETFLQFAREVNAIGDYNELWKDGWITLNEVSAEQSIYLEEEDETRRYLSILRSALDSKKSHLEVIPEFKDLSFDPEMYGYRKEKTGIDVEFRPSNSKIGWFDKDYIYLIPDTSYALIQKISREQGSPIAVTQDTLYKRMKEKNYLVVDGKDRRIRKQKVINGIRARYITIRHDLVFPPDVIIPN